MGTRDSMLDHLKLLSHASAQLEYEKSLTVGGHAPTELVSVFCDDLYQPKDVEFFQEFSSDEYRGFAHLYGLLVEVAQHKYSNVSEMLKDPKWRRIVEVAQNLAAQIKITR